jgi:hypothetical protein
VAAARDIHIKKINSLLIVRFQADHEGGTPEFSQLMSIRNVINHDHCV